MTFRSDGCAGCGTWNPLLQTGHPPGTKSSQTQKIQKNYKGLKITVCMHKLGQIMGKKMHTKTKRTQPTTSEEPGKQGVGTKSRSAAHMFPACNTTHQGVGKTPKPSLWPNSWTCCPYPLHIKTSSAQPPQGNQQGTCYFLFPQL